MKTNAEMIIGLHQALLGNIPKHIRMICIYWDEDSLILRIYTECDVKDVDFDLADLILTEYESYMDELPFKNMESEVIFSQSPLYDLDSLKLTLFARDEIFP